LRIAENARKTKDIQDETGGEDAPLHCSHRRFAAFTDMLRKRDQLVKMLLTRGWDLYRKNLPSFTLVRQIEEG
jgi:hypothetical protein